MIIETQSNVCTINNADFNNDLYQFSKKNLKVFMKDPSYSSCNTAIHSEIRKGIINGQVVDRLVVFLRGTGCEWMKTGGGCTMCGFHVATNSGVMLDDNAIVEQVKNAIIDYEKFQSPIICLYNDGSFLNKNEVSKKACMEIYKYINQCVWIKRLVIESRPEYITEESLQLLRSELSIDVEIAVGLETVSDEIRKECLNKGFNYELFKKAVDIASNFNIVIRPLLIVKPPFLTEQESIDDCVETICRLKEIGITAVDLELMTIQNETVVKKLWENNDYELPFLWSVVEIILSAPVESQIYISPVKYSVEHSSQIKNCASCSDLISRNLIDKYSTEASFDRSKLQHWLQNYECACKTNWRKQKELHDSRSIALRVQESLQRIAR